jgi:CYTH domain-containing protein/CHAD domain-containing protein
MSSEIERKFLLGELPDWLAEGAGERISQGYLSNGEGPEIRLRRSGERTLLTVKEGAGEIREETEVELDPYLFRTLWPLTAGRRVTKTRLRQPLGDGHTAEIDVYAEGLAGLVVGEVEFSSREESRKFRPPAWLGKEVTGDARYANRELAMNDAPPAEAPAQEPSRCFRLKRKEEVGEGRVRAIRGRAAKAIEALREEAPEDPASAIHSARKDVKKIRAVLRLLRAGIGEKAYRAENRRYRDAGRALSGSRDAEVKVETLTALEERFGLQLPSASAWNWKRVLERERREAASEIVDSKAIDAAAAALEGGREAAAGWSLDGSWKLFGPGLAEGYKRGRKAMARVAADPDPELVHEWRKRSKDLWYDLRLVRRAWPQLLEPTVDGVHELSDLLGDHHDLTVLAADLASRPRVGSKARMAALIEQRQAEILEQALGLGARLYAEKPPAFVKRIHGIWKAWR